MTIRGMVARVLHAIKSIVSSTQYVGWACLAGMAGLMFVGTIARYVFNKPFIFTEEIVEHLMIPLSFLCFAYVFLIDGHIKVDIITRRLSQKWQSCLLAFNQVLTIIFFLVLSVASWTQIGISLQLDRRFETIYALPMVYFRIIMLVGCGLAVIFLITRFGENVYGIVKHWRQRSSMSK